MRVRDREALRVSGEELERQGGLTNPFQDSAVAEASFTSFGESLAGPPMST